MEQIVVTRHTALVAHLLDLGLVQDGVAVLAHATPEDLRGKHVIGVLPHHMSALAALYTEVPLLVPEQLRGRELSLEQVRQYAGAPVTYRVEVVA